MTYHYWSITHSQLRPFAEKICSFISAGSGLSRSDDAWSRDQPLITWQNISRRSERRLTAFQIFNKDNFWVFGVLRWTILSTVLEQTREYVDVAGWEQKQISEREQALWNIRHTTRGNKGQRRPQLLSNRLLIQILNETVKILTTLNRKWRQ